MANIEVKLPAMGEGIIEATITRWIASEGLELQLDDPLVEVATDKVDSEVPAPASGKLIKIFCHEGEMVKVGQVMALIVTNGDMDVPDKLVDAGPPEKVIEKPATVLVTTPPEAFFSPQDPVQMTYKYENNSFISPFIRNLAQQRGISYETLLTIPGTGLNNRLTKEDLNNYIRLNKEISTNYGVTEPFTGKANAVNYQTPASGEMPVVPDNFNIVEMDRIRKLIADNMLKAKQTAPHVTSFAEADVTEMVTWRESVKDSFRQSEGVSLTYTALFTEIVARALKEFPRINASVDGNKIIIKNEINIGIATALQDGNLVVPVIKNTDQENLRGLAHKIASLASKARQNRLLPTDIRNGTFTITNIGQFNSITGTPIINIPEVAILAIGTIKKKPAVVKTDYGLSIGIRDIIMLSLTYDHRIIDGSLGGEFLNRINYYLENFDKDKKW